MRTEMREPDRGRRPRVATFSSRIISGKRASSSITSASTRRCSVPWIATPETKKSTQPTIRRKAGLRATMRSPATALRDARLVRAWGRTLAHAEHAQTAISTGKRDDDRHARSREAAGRRPRSRASASHDERPPAGEHLPGGRDRFAPARDPRALVVVGRELGAPGLVGQVDHREAEVEQGRPDQQVRCPEVTSSPGTKIFHSEKRKSGVRRATIQGFRRPRGSSQAVTEPFRSAGR